MDWLATSRIAFLGIMLMPALPAHADAELDELVRHHVMHRFDRQARVIIRNSGARFVSSSWNRETRTLIAVGEMERRLSAGSLSVALENNPSARTPGLKTEHLTELCRNPKVGLISRFLEKHDVTITLVYGRKHLRIDPVIIEISHDDLSGCA